uniref:Putative conserved secreted protein n=1 Tax=Corethrella appendiculata TaxID=1370023 RepID=U5EKY8_9DIPT
MNFLLLLISILMTIDYVKSTPILLDKLFGFSAYHASHQSHSHNSPSSGYRNSHKSRDYYYHTTKATKSREHRGRSYKELCRVINANPYAFPGRVPYPAAPFCPY